MIYAWDPNWAQQNRPGYEVVNATCDKSDSDNNGRVRCNLTLKSPAGEFENPPIECPSRWMPQFSDECQIVRATGLF